MNGEIIFKRYQFEEDDVFVFVDVDLIKRTIKIKHPLFYRLIPLKTKHYWQWAHIKNFALNKLDRVYHNFKIIIK